MQKQRQTVQPVTTVSQPLAVPRPALVDPQIKAVFEHLRPDAHLAVAAAEEALHRAYHSAGVRPTDLVDDLSQLEKTQLTNIGTDFEILFRNSFSLSEGDKLDYLISGCEVDMKWSKSCQWMIPSEAVGQLIIVAGLNKRGLFDLGLIRANDNWLTRGGNRDGKRNLNALGKSNICYLLTERTLSAPRPVSVLNPLMSEREREGVIAKLTARGISRDEVLRILQPARNL